MLLLPDCSGELGLKTKMLLQSPWQHDETLVGTSEEVFCQFIVFSGV